MNVELSESESIKQTLEIERMIDGGCDVLLDANQKFIKTGKLLETIFQNSLSSSYL